MKFIFPQNYNFNNKLFGSIDYSTAIFNLIWISLIILILNLFSISLIIKIFITIIFCLPLLLLSLLGVNGENIIYIFFYIIKYVFHQKVLLYNK